ncbi:hypothetical protein BDA99DRAFT_569250 [Phascolomyces articulosus]|uniref:Uncharacterized protein n=1 Tax=Phascolomyces articulosus TaxID=60185 RepID=A0AAD5KJY7_9FUNG|nr:hypothetical protein BDA99DRAFT_569250 [Phascolomyces articulosus]
MLLVGDESKREREAPVVFFVTNTFGSSAHPDLLVYLFVVSALTSLGGDAKPGAPMKRSGYKIDERRWGRSKRLYDNKNKSKEANSSLRSLASSKSYFGAKCSIIPSRTTNERESRKIHHRIRFTAIMMGTTHAWERSTTYILQEHPVTWIKYICRYQVYNIYTHSRNSSFFLSLSHIY